MNQCLRRDAEEIIRAYLTGVLSDAAGEVVGVIGDDSMSGANNGWAVTAGGLAAVSIAKALALEAAA